VLVIDPDFRALIPPLAPEELEQLEANILRDGCRDPLAVWGATGILLDGHNRYDICAKHGLSYQTTPVSLKTRDEAADWIDANQLGRRNLAPDQQSILRGRRYNRTKKAQGGDRKSKCQIDTLIDASAALAKQHGVSPATIKRDGKFAAAVEKVKAIDPQIAAKITSGKAAPPRSAVIKAAQLLEASPEKAAKILRGETTVNAVVRAEREAKRETRRKDNADKAKSAANPAVSGARFATILIDPPWDWGDEGDGNQMGRAKPDYATVPFEDLLKLPVPKLADDDAHLYLWVTNRSLPKGFALMDAWGFRYITALTWPKPSFGMGNYFRGQTEHVLFGVKGTQPLLRKDASTLLPPWKRGAQHSSKPQEFYGFIEACSPGPYAELFSRHPRAGWFTWGADV